MPESIPPRVTTSNPVEEILTATPESPSETWRLQTQLSSTTETELPFSDTDYDYIDENEFSSINFDFDTDFSREFTTKPSALSSDSSFESKPNENSISIKSTEANSNPDLNSDFTTDKDIILALILGLILLTAITIIYLLLLLTILKLIQVCKYQSSQSEQLNVTS